MIEQRTLYDVFLRQANISQDNIAIREANQEISYAEFILRIDALANAFLSEGLSKHSVVAIVLPPSWQFLAVMFACLKLGIPYIPLNVRYPQSYIAQILQDARISAVISKVGLIKDADEFKFIDVNNISFAVLTAVPIQAQVAPESIAYIIYTSGSTGSPKGVIITHRNLLSLMEATKLLYKINSDDVGVLFHSLGFDFSVWEICFPLIHGATLVIVPEVIKQSISDYCYFLLEQKVSILNVTPSLLYLLQDMLLETVAKNPSISKLRYVISGGEALYPAKLKRWFESPLLKSIEIYNMYGITEGTIHSTFKKIGEQDTLKSISPIGVPLTNVEIIVVNEWDELVGIDEIGELCLTGAAVTNGYLNHPELNVENFLIKNFDNRGQLRYFKTKDLVKKSASGDLEYIERKDNVLKVKGFRVSASEIENYLIRYNFVENAVVSTYLDGGNIKRLVAYLQGEKHRIDVEVIRKDLQMKLPDFMHLSRLIVVEKFPLTINGKIDLSKLSELLQYYPFTSELMQEENSLEERIKQVWQKVLSKEDVNLEENFFDAGGDSLLLPSLQFMLQESLNKEIELIDLVRFPSINEFAKFVRDTDQNMKG